MNWSSRPARIARLKEKTHFDQVIMPLAYAGVSLASLVLFWQGLELLEGNRANAVWWVPALFFFGLPGPLWIYRWLRKHYHPNLHA